MSTISANRPLNVVAKAPVKVQGPATPAPVTAPSANGPKVSDWWVNRNAIDIVQTGAAVGQAAGRVVFTPPVLFDIVKSSLKSGISVSNLAWQVVPSAISNVRNVFSGKISAARGGANVATETVFGIGKGIVSGVTVQALSIATGPLLGLLPLSPTILPFVGMGVGLLGLVGSYFVMNKVIKATGADKKMSDALTNVFGGDKAPAPAAKA